MFIYRPYKYNNSNNIYVNIIRECYIEVLEREPDPSGLNTYTRQLNRGWSKFDIKMDLYNSHEGKMKLKKKMEYQAKQKQLNSNPKPKQPIKLKSNPKPKEQIEYKTKSTNANLFFESIESDKLSDLEFFNILQKNVKSSYNHKDNIKDPVYYKIINGYVNNYTSNSIKFFYCINKSTYNNFYIEEINDEYLDILTTQNENQYQHYSSLEIHSSFAFPYFVIFLGMIFHYQSNLLLPQTKIYCLLIIYNKKEDF